MLKVDVHRKFRSRRRSVIISLKTEIDTAKITAFYGKSGVGKSSVLRMIAGLEKPELGRVEFQGQTWFSSSDKINLPVAKRKLGFVFQEYNLFPNMTVEKNLAYASANGQIPADVADMIIALDVESLMGSYPHELSGGQKQRVAILRTLCQEPDALLLDEPFSALDDDTISDLIEVIKTIRKEKAIMILIVSHRKDIIFKMADAVIHLKENGEFLQGTPQDILSRSL